MPSTSKAQQRFFGMVTAYKRGKLKSASPKVKSVSRNISASAALDFAKKAVNKHDVTKPKKKKEKTAVASSRNNLARSLA